MSGALVSVVIPTLDEQRTVPAAIESALAAAGVEVIVADGGSADDTVSVARRLGAQVVSAPRGRARQMNAGAAAAGRGIIVFLHADTRLPAGFEVAVRDVLARPGVAGGAFLLAVDGPGRGLRLLERLVAFRSRRLGLPYGDQAIFVRRAVFDAVGGYPDIRVMEDFELVRRLRRRGRIGIVPQPVRTSARRWARHGLVRTTALNQCIVAAHLLGVSDERLARWRSRDRGTAAGGQPARV